LAQTEARLVQFKDEIKIARRIRHPNVCANFDFLIIENRPAISMEFISGTLLVSIIKKESHSLTDRYEIMMGCLLGLKAAHDTGVIHRDLKPDNIMIQSDMRPIIMDFGIASTLRKDGEDKDISIYGTPNYWAPEQFEGFVLDQRSDIYSLGVICYEMLTGRKLYDDQTMMSMIMEKQKIKVDPPSVYNSEISAEIDDLICKCLEMDPKNRYGSVDLIIQDLQKSMSKHVGFSQKSDRPRILVVDDEEKMRTMIQKLLSMNDYEVITADDGEAGVQVAMSAQPDLILMDLMMPKMDGCRAAEILGNNPSTQNIPIILLTSIVSDEYQTFSRSIGIKEYLNKPFRVNELLEKIKFYLSLIKS